MRDLLVASTSLHSSSRWWAVATSDSSVASLPLRRCDSLGACAACAGGFAEYACSWDAAEGACVELEAEKEWLVRRKEDCPEEEEETTTTVNQYVKQKGKS